VRVGYRVCLDSQCIFGVSRILFTVYPPYPLVIFKKVLLVIGTISMYTRREKMFKKKWGKRGKD
jgi:hypothetical protein